MSVALVTGGGSGIGAAAALALAGDGWTVVIAGRRAAPLDELVGAHPDLRLESATADVTDAADVDRLVDGVVERHGRLDLLFNNAGMGSAYALPDAVELDDWQAVLNVNVTGVVLCSRAAFRVMRAQHPSGGRIINNGSIAASSPRPGSLPYTATKHAISGVTKQLALDGRPFGIACGQIDIGNAVTAMGSGAADGALQPDGSVRPEAVMPVEQVGRAVAFMASMPPGSNVLNMTIMATTMPFVGRG